MRNSQRSNVWAQYLQSSACSWLLNIHLNLKSARLIAVYKRTFRSPLRVWAALTIEIPERRLGWVYWFVPQEAQLCPTNIWIKVKATNCFNSCCNNVTLLVLGVMLRVLQPALETFVQQILCCKLRENVAKSSSDFYLLQRLAATCNMERCLS